MVPEGIDEVELARIEIEALERECKGLAEVGPADCGRSVDSEPGWEKKRLTRWASYRASFKMPCGEV